MSSSGTKPPKIQQGAGKGRCSQERGSITRTETNRTGRERARSKPGNQSKNNAAESGTELKQSGKERAHNTAAHRCPWLAGARCENESQVWQIVLIDT